MRFLVQFHSLNHTSFFLMTLITVKIVSCIQLFKEISSFSRIHLLWIVKRKTRQYLNLKAKVYELCVIYIVQGVSKNDSSVFYYQLYYGQRKLSLKVKPPVYERNQIYWYASLEPFQFLNGFVMIFFFVFNF